MATSWHWKPNLQASWKWNVESSMHEEPTLEFEAIVWRGGYIVVCTGIGAHCRASTAQSRSPSPRESEREMLQWGGNGTRTGAGGLSVWYHKYRITDCVVRRIACPRGLVSVSLGSWEVVFSIAQPGSMWCRRLTAPWNFEDNVAGFLDYRWALWRELILWEEGCHIFRTYQA